uniref:Synenkephalin n=1 Tax=Oncorhynchus tshawytscha TaxID=74940 RepID=A0AAZ3PT74_ONCTS
MNIKAFRDTFVSNPFHLYASQQFFILGLLGSLLFEAWFTSGNWVFFIGQCSSNQHLQSRLIDWTPECEGSLDTTKLRLCRDVLLEEVDDIKQEEVQGQQHQLAKKYGGFMKRYGGFMIRRRSPVEGRVQGGENSLVAEEEDIRLEILKILNAEAEGQRDEEVGGLGGLEGVGRPLKKRYGGFMRRVGRPEWLEDQKNQGGLLKRSWEGEQGDSPLAEIQKRYGGFMD